MTTRVWVYWERTATDISTAIMERNEYILDTHSTKYAQKSFYVLNIPINFVIRNHRPQSILLFLYHCDFCNLDGFESARRQAIIWTNDGYIPDAYTRQSSSMS